MQKNVVYLYSELIGYQIPVFEELATRHKCNVYVIHSVVGKTSKYQVPIVPGVVFYKKEEFKRNELISFVTDLKPDIVYISGWMYFDYLSVVYKLRKNNILVVSGFDDLWFNTFKQRLASLIFPFVKKKFFSHAWVAGPYQYEFARKIGFKKSEIIFNCLSADIDKFNKAYIAKEIVLQKKVPHNFLYVGRFQKIKGVDLLVQAWEKLSNYNHDWKLTLIGNGPLLPNNSNIKNLEIIDFMQPEELVGNLNKYCCIVIPSRKEQWSVVMHEFASAGFPIISSSACGALPIFLINQYNGFIYKNYDVQDLVEKMLQIIKLDDVDLLNMSKNSHQLGQRITPKIAAASLLSIVSN